MAKFKIRQIYFHRGRLNFLPAPRAVAVFDLLTMMFTSSLSNRVSVHPQHRKDTIETRTAKHHSHRSTIELLHSASGNQKLICSVCESQLVFSLEGETDIHRMLLLSNLTVGSKLLIAIHRSGSWIASW